MSGSAIGVCVVTCAALVRRGAWVFWACALPIALAALIALGGPSPAAAAGSCPNEKVREESSLIPGTASHYAQELPECRAYEMVSPLEKGGHDADIGGQSGALALPVWTAPGGEALVWHAEGAFGGAENFTSTTAPENAYISQRTESGWKTSSYAPPRSVVNVPYFNGFVGDASPDLRSVHGVCGLRPNGSGEELYQSVVCAERRNEGPWITSPSYSSVGDLALGTWNSVYLGMGWSTPTLRAFVAPPADLLPEDKVGKILTPLASTGSIYEIAIGESGASTLRLVNMDNDGNVLTAEVPGQGIASPSLGSYQLTTGEFPAGTEERAISQSGEAVFFTAAPNPLTPEGTLNLYARVPCRLQALPCDTKSDGHEVEGRQTVNVSLPDPAEGCDECNTAVGGSVKESALYQGASADGSKVFFTTTHPLLDSAAEIKAEEEAKEQVEKEAEEKKEVIKYEKEPSLYEYNFNGEEGHKVTKLSKTTAIEGAKVTGVAEISADGSHVYFLAKGALPGAEPTKSVDAEGNAVEEPPVPGSTNLYVYDTDAEAEGKKPLKLVMAGLPDRELEGLSLTDSKRVQTTPDGRFLAFSAPAVAAGDLNTTGCPLSCPQAVYRYDADTRELTWVSHSALEPDGATFTAYHPEGASAIVGGCSAPCGGFGNADAAREDMERTISDDGRYIIFATAEKLQGNDVNGSSDVYLWHEGPVQDEGAVHMISDGRNPQGVGNETPGNPGGPPVASMSASGSDIFFITRTELLPRDTDDLVDVYDARIEGGFAEPVRASCAPASEGGCQGVAPEPPPAATPPTSSFPAGGNLLAPLASSLAFKTTSKPPPTRAQKLASALKRAERNTGANRAWRANAKPGKNTRPRRRRRGDARVDHDVRRSPWAITGGCVAQRLRARGLLRLGGSCALTAMGSDDVAQERLRSPGTQVLRKRHGGKHGGHGAPSWRSARVCGSKWRNRRPDGEHHDRRGTRTAGNRRLAYHVASLARDAAERRGDRAGRGVYEVPENGHPRFERPDTGTRRNDQAGGIDARS